MPEPYEYPDALPDGPVRGRGAGNQPGNRFETVRLHVLGEHLDAIRQPDEPPDPKQGSGVTAAESHDGTDDRSGSPRQVATTVRPDHSRTIINRVVDTPDIGFDWTINPYRGCEHGCVYCYARPTHEYLGLSSGLDFETVIYAKFDAASLLKKELASPRWKAQTIVISGVTDPYQPIERRLGITRQIVEILAASRQPVSFITKNRLILRDLDLLRELVQHRAVHVGVSITTLDASLAATMEPRASSPADRLATIATLRDAGVPVMAMVAPIIPGLTDREMPAILHAISEAGAHAASYVLLRLPYQVKALYTQWLETHHPHRAAQAEHLLRESRRGKLYDAAFGERMRGSGAVAEQIGRMFRLFARRYGLDRPLPRLSSEGFRPPHVGPQMRLFD